MSIFLVLFRVLEEMIIKIEKLTTEPTFDIYIILLSFGFGWDFYPYKVSNIHKEIYLLNERMNGKHSTYYQFIK